MAIQGETRQSLAKCLASLWGWWAGAHQTPKGGRSLQEGRSESHSGWKRPSRRTSRVHFTAERMPRFTREATAPPFTETSPDLVALRLNPWWYPHGLHTPADDGSGGPFTIGRVIHSSRSVGFNGWIGGVAVFNRA